MEPGQGPLCQCWDPSLEQTEQTTLAILSRRPRLLLKTSPTLHTRTHYVFVHCFNILQNLHASQLVKTYLALPSSRVWMATLGPLGAWFNAADDTLPCSALLQPDSALLSESEEGS